MVRHLAKLGALLLAFGWATGLPAARVGLGDYWIAPNARYWDEKISFQMNQWYLGRQQVPRNAVEALLPNNAERQSPSNGSHRNLQSDAEKFNAELALKMDIALTPGRSSLLPPGPHLRIAKGGAWKLSLDSDHFDKASTLWSLGGVEYKTDQVADVMANLGYPNLANDFERGANVELLGGFLTGGGFALLVPPLAAGLFSFLPIYVNDGRSSSSYWSQPLVLAGLGVGLSLSITGLSLNAVGAHGRLQALNAFYSAP